MAFLLAHCVKTNIDGISNQDFQLVSTKSGKDTAFRISSTKYRTLKGLFIGYQNEVRCSLERSRVMQESACKTLGNAVMIQFILGLGVFKKHVCHEPPVYCVRLMHVLIKDDGSMRDCTFREGGTKAVS
jgi:hypothetical protein